MNRHKRDLLDAYWAYSPSVDGTILVPTADVIGGRLAVRQVRTFLNADLKLAREELKLAEEREVGAEWWRRYMDEPARAMLLDALERTVRQRPGEDLIAFRKRLERVAEHYRRVANYP